MHSFIEFLYFYEGKGIVSSCEWSNRVSSRPNSLFGLPRFTLKSKEQGFVSNVEAKWVMKTLICWKIFIRTICMYLIIYPIKTCHAVYLRGKNCACTEKELPNINRIRWLKQTNKEVDSSRKQILVCVNDLHYLATIFSQPE